VSCALLLAQVYAALAYYDANCDEIEAAIAVHPEEAAALEETHGQTILALSGEPSGRTRM
jgi:hypothetical protein